MIDGFVFRLKLVPIQNLVICERHLRQNILKDKDLATLHNRSKPKQESAKPHFQTRTSLIFGQKPNT